MPTTKEPIIIPKNKISQIQVSVQEFKGKQYVDVRLFNTTQGLEARPTGKGITMNASNVDLIVEAINKVKVDLDDYGKSDE